MTQIWSDLLATAIAAGGLGYLSGFKSGRHAEERRVGFPPEEAGDDFTPEEIAEINAEFEAFKRRRAEICICAAIRLPDGEIFRGHRHGDALAVAGKCDVAQAETFSAVQGFITSRNRFVTREEGAALQRWAGIPSADTGLEVGDRLFSEDLYLRQTKGQNLPRLAPPASSAEPGRVTE